MRASELIQKLQEQIELHGDCKVWIGEWDYEYDCDASRPAHEVVFEGQYSCGNLCYDENIIFVQ